MNFLVVLLYTLFHSCLALRFNEASITEVVENVEDGEEGRRRRRRRRRKGKKGSKTDKEGEDGGRRRKAGQDSSSDAAGKNFKPGNHNSKNVEFLVTMKMTDALKPTGVVTAKKPAFLTAIIAAIDEPVFEALKRIQGGASSEASIASANAKLTGKVSAVEIEHFNKLQESSLAEVSHASRVTFKISFPEDCGWDSTSDVLPIQYEAVFSDTLFMQAARTALEAVQTSGAFTDFCCNELTDLVGSKTSYMEWESSMILQISRTDVAQLDSKGAEAQNKVDWESLGFRGVSETSDNEVAMGFGQELTVGLSDVFNIVVPSDSAGSMIIKDIQLIKRLIQTTWDVEFKVHALSADESVVGLDTTKLAGAFYDNMVASADTGLRLALATSMAKDLKLPLLSTTQLTGVDCAKIVFVIVSGEGLTDGKLTAAAVKAKVWKLTATFRYLAYAGDGLEGSALPAIVSEFTAVGGVTQHAADAMSATYTTTTEECTGLTAPCPAKVITFLAGATDRKPLDASTAAAQQNAAGAAVTGVGASTDFTANEANLVRVSYVVRLYDRYSNDIASHIKKCKSASAFDNASFGTSLISSLAKTDLKDEWGITVDKVISEPRGKIHVKTA